MFKLAKDRSNLSLEFLFMIIKKGHRSQDKTRLMVHGHIFNLDLQIAIEEVLIIND